MKIKVAINGLGRIGRCIIRAIIENDHPDIEIVAANGPAKIEDHFRLLKYDSVHGRFFGNLALEGDYIIAGRHKIRIYGEKDPLNLPWSGLAVDIVLECSGKFNNKEAATKHIQAGAKKVIVSAPCENADATIVKGVNHDKLKGIHEVISIGSCTTNALAPIAKILNDNIGIERGFMTTIHSYTNDQNIIDGSHKDPRRARAAALSMVPTSTGAAKAIGLVIPELAGKLAGSAVRVPTPNVSMVDLVFDAAKETNIEEVNNLVKKYAQADMKNIVVIADDKLVSVDFNHNAASTVFDPYETVVTDKKLVRVVSWYDNEWGFSNRMLDVTSLFGKML